MADAQQPPPELALEAIPSFVESQMLAFNSLEVGRGAESSSGGRGNLGGGPSGGEPIVGIEPWDRWELRFTTSNLEEYKQQLDYFGIELGVAGGGQPVVHYVKGFSGSRPSVRVGSPRDEKRIRFLYADGPLKRADRELVRAAGVEVAGRVVFHFYSDEMYQSLLQLENDRMQPRRISEVIRTVFGVRRAGAGFEFFIIRQDYRHGGVKATRVAPQGPAT